MVMYGAPVLPIAQGNGADGKIRNHSGTGDSDINSKPCKSLGREDELGMIKEGLLADILVVDGDLSKDISCVYNVNTVYLGGKTVYSQGVRFV